MTLTQDQPVRPWGLSRIAKPSPVGPPEYATVEFDAATQLTHFYDARGEIVDMQRGTVTKSPKNQGNDGTGGPLVSDDSDD